MEESEVRDGRGSAAREARAALLVGPRCRSVVLISFHHFNNTFIRQATSSY